MDTERKKISYADILSQKEYLKIIFSNIINRFGDSVDAIAFTWLVYAVTESASWSAVIFALNQLPSVLLQPFAGPIVERMNKKRVMVASDIVRGVITAGLAVMYFTGHTNPWVLAVFTFCNSSVEAFCLPAGMALIPQILKDEYYAYGTSLNTTVSTIVQLIGYGAAGFIIGKAGIEAAIMIDAFSFFGSAIIRAFLHVKESFHNEEKMNMHVYMEMLKDGMRCVKEKTVIRNFCMLGIVVNAIVVPLNSLQSPLVSEVFEGGSELLSLISVLCTAGMGMGAFLCPILKKKISVNNLITGGGILVGAGMILYTFGIYCKNFQAASGMLAGIASLLIGIGVSLVSAVLGVQFVEAVKQEYLARVGAIFNALATAAVPAASIVVSVLAGICSVRQIFMVSGLVCVLLFGYIKIRKVQFE